MWQDRPSGTKICHFKCSTRISNPAIRSTKKKANLNMTNGQTLQHLHTLKKTAKNDSNKHMLYLYNMVCMLYVIIYDYMICICVHAHAILQIYSQALESHESNPSHSWISSLANNNSFWKKCWKKKPLSITPGSDVGVKVCFNQQLVLVPQHWESVCVWVNIVFLSVDSIFPFTPNRNPNSQKNWGGTVIQKELL